MSLKWTIKYKVKLSANSMRITDWAPAEVAWEGYMLALLGFLGLGESTVQPDRMMLLRAYWRTRTWQLARPASLLVLVAGGCHLSLPNHEARMPAEWDMTGTASSSCWPTAMLVQP